MFIQIRDSDSSSHHHALSLSLTHSLTHSPTHSLSASSAPESWRKMRAAKDSKAGEAGASGVYKEFDDGR
jgi:hypothetical protein